MFEEGIDGSIEGFFSKDLVEKHLSDGIVKSFFEAKLDDKGNVYGYSVKAPYVGFKLVSNGETERVYQFSYLTSPGLKMISIVTIDEADGSYRIKNTVEVVDNSPQNRVEDIRKKLIYKMNNR